MISNFILMYLITTTFTGSVAFAIWYFLEQKFDRHKLDALLYYSLKFVILLFLIPLLLLPYLFPYPFASPWEFGTIATRAFNCALACVWVVGAIKTLVCIVKNEHEHSVMENTYFEASDIHKQLLEEVKAELHIKRKIEIYVGEERQSPFMRGIIRPRIFMPTNIQSPQDITYSLHHELTHYLHHDLWMLFLLNVLHVIHWFNPIIPQLAPFLKKWTEIYVDCTVSSPKRLGNSYTKFLIRLLLSYQEDAQKQQAVKAQQISPAVGMSEEDHKKKIDTAKRIDRLIDRPKYTTLKKRIVIGLLMLGIGSGVIALSVFWNGIEFGSRTAYEELVVKEEEAYSDIQVERKALIETMMWDESWEPLEGEVEEEAGAFSSMYYFNWTIPAEQIMMAPSFSVEKTCQFTLSLVTLEDTRPQIGLLLPDGTYIILETLDTSTYQLSLTQTGEYRLFITNKVGVSINCLGCYYFSPTN